MKCISIEMTIKYLIIALLLVGVEEENIKHTILNNVSYDTRIHHDKYVGKPILIYRNSVVTFRFELLACGDVQSNPGPIDNDNHVHEQFHPNVSVSSTQYSRDDLLQLNNPQHQLPAQTWSTLRELNINRRSATHRGCRAGVHAREHRDRTGGGDHNVLPCQIPVVVSERKTKHHPSLAHTGHNNLTEIPRSGQFLNIWSWNARSVRNKTGYVTEFIRESNIDIFFLQETWLWNEEEAVIAELTPIGYSYLNFPRDSVNRGGGIGILFHSAIKLTIVPLNCNVKSFEYACVIEGQTGLIFLCIYRPPPSTTNQLHFHDFLTDFNTILDEVSVMPNKLLLLGDFNVHVNHPDKWNVRPFLDSLWPNGFEQLITVPTHISGNTLGILIQRPEDNVVVNHEVQELLLSDHYLIKCKIAFQKPHIGRKYVTKRSFRNFDEKSFNKNLKMKLYEVPETISDVNVLVDHYIVTCKSVLDCYAPYVSRSVAVRTQLPWFSEEIREARRVRRRLERKWRKNKLDHDRLLYLEQLRLVNDLILQAKTNFLRTKIAGANDKDLYSTVNTLLNRNKRSLPVYDSANDMSERFARFFKTKTDKIRKALDEVDVSSLIMTSKVNECQATHHFSHFNIATVDEVERVIGKLSNKTCSLDPLPTWLLRENIGVVSPFITRIANASMQSGVFPDALKDAIVTPVLKKPSLDSNNLKNYRPVSNIHYLAKILETLIASRLKDFFTEHSLDDPLQSAYRKRHSTETALLKVQGDILHQLDRNRVVMLVMLDLTAAFDTIDHVTLIRRLENSFGITGPPLDWCSTYMSSRRSRVNIEGQFSKNMSLNCGVPQGSIMGPLVFNKYTHPLGKIISSHKLLYHKYADDDQLYTSYNPNIPNDHESAIKRMHDCINDINVWMTLNKLKLNMGKTEFLVIGSTCHLRQLPQLQLQIGTAIVKPVSSVRNLGIFFDHTMSMDKQVSELCRKLNYQIYNIARIRRYLEIESCHHIVRSLVTSRMDYGNSLLAGLTENNLNKLQRVQNKAARIIFRLKRRDHITPYLHSLHWLPVRQRINFKLLVIIYQCVNHDAPVYLCNDISLHSSTVTGTRILRSAMDATKLHIPRTSKTVGDHAYSVAGPRTWNTLPISIREAPTIHSFKKSLKSHLYPYQ